MPGVISKDIFWCIQEQLTSLGSNSQPEYSLNSFLFSLHLFTKLWYYVLYIKYHMGKWRMSGKKENLSEIDVVPAFKLWVCVHMCTLTSKLENPTLYTVLIWVIEYSEVLNVMHLTGSLESRTPHINRFLKGSSLGHSCSYWPVNLYAVQTG